MDIPMQVQAVLSPSKRLLAVPEQEEQILLLRSPIQELIRKIVFQNDLRKPWLIFTPHDSFTRQQLFDC